MILWTDKIKKDRILLMRSFCFVRETEDGVAYLPNTSFEIVCSGLRKGTICQIIVTRSGLAGHR